MMLCKILDGSFTDDSLLYFTLWIISRGRELYLKALSSPDLLVSMFTHKDNYRSFELFMDLGLDLKEESDNYSDEEIAMWELSAEEKSSLQQLLDIILLITSPLHTTKLQKELSIPCERSDVPVLTCMIYMTVPISRKFCFGKR